MSGRQDERDLDRHRARDEARRDEQPRQAGGHQRPPQLARVHQSQLRKRGEFIFFQILDLLSHLKLGFIEEGFLRMQLAL